MTGEVVETDRYGRQVARCSVNGDDLAALMVRSGRWIGRATREGPMRPIRIRRKLDARKNPSYS